LVAVTALAMASASAAEGTELVRRAGTPLADVYQDRKELPRELSIDALSPTEIAKIKQGILTYLKEHRPERADGIEGCMQWVFLRHSKKEPWAAVGYSLPSHRAGAVKINGTLRPASINYGIAPDIRPARGWFRGATSVPGTRPGGGAIFVRSFADRSDFAVLLSQLDSDNKNWLRNHEGTSEPRQWNLRLAPVSGLRVASPRARCTLLAAECRQYTSAVDNDAQWLPPGVGGSPPTNQAAVPGSLAPDLRTEIAIEDMCPFSRQGLVEGAVNTRADPVEHGIKAFGIPGNASLKAALANN
jgi:hypothetical protein